MAARARLPSPGCRSTARQPSSITCVRKPSESAAGAFWDALGERRNPTIVFDHPGEATIPTSIFLVDNGGMVVICAGTSGYNADVDLRYLWMRQKRFQGSHFASVEECAEFNDYVVQGRIDPALSRVFAFDEIGASHQLMYENEHPPGNMAILVGAPREGLTDSPV